MSWDVCHVCAEHSEHLQFCRPILTKEDVYKNERPSHYKARCCDKCASVMYTCYDCKSTGIKITNIYPFSNLYKANYKHPQMGICHNCYERRPPKKEVYYGSHYDEGCSTCGNRPGGSGFYVSCGCSSRYY